MHLPRIAYMSLPAMNAIKCPGSLKHKDLLEFSSSWLAMIVLFLISRNWYSGARN